MPATGRGSADPSESRRAGASVAGDRHERQGEGDDEGGERRVEGAEEHVPRALCRRVEQDSARRALGDAAGDADGEHEQHDGDQQEAEDPRLRPQVAEDRVKLDVAAEHEPLDVAVVGLVADAAHALLGDEHVRRRRDRTPRRSPTGGAP